MEVAVTSECSGQLWNICVWDPLTGTVLRTFKGGISCAKSLGIVGGDYIISSLKDKPILQVWALNRQDQITSKMIMPGIVRVLTLSPCNNYCAGAINEQLFIWQLATGALVASVKRHYQDITNIQFTADSSRVVTTGSEGLVLVWNLETLLNTTDCEPDVTWSDHSLPVTGLHVTKSLVQPFAFTVSLDQTCKLRDINSGKTLLAIQFSEPLTCVVADHAEETCYVGSQSGKIYRTLLTDPPRNLEQSADETDKWLGHDKAVTCLSVSTDACHLLSGSDDGSVRVWDVASGQCVKILQHRGPLTNVFYAPRYKHLESDKFQPRLSVTTFEKKKRLVETAQVLTRCRPIEDDRNQFERSDMGEQVAQNELNSLKRINRQLYSFAVDKILTETGNKKRK